MTHAELRTIEYRDLTADTLREMVERGETETKLFARIVKTLEALNSQVRKIRVRHGLPV